MQEQTLKEKVVTIVRAIIASGRGTAQIQVKSFLSILGEPNFDKTIKGKIEVFDNVPEDSNFFRIIYSTAKNSLADLKNNIINIHAAELIKIFYTLDDRFKNPLLSKDFKEKDEKTFCESVKESAKTINDSKVIEIKEGVTGIQFLTAKILDEKSTKDLSEALNNL